MTGVADRSVRQYLIVGKVYASILMASGHPARDRRMAIHAFDVDV